MQNNRIWRREGEWTLFEGLQIGEFWRASFQEPFGIF